MRRLLRCAALVCLPCNASSIAQAIEIDAPWQSVPGWNIIRSATYQGCIAQSRYVDGTSVRLGYDGIIKAYFVNFSNSKWSDYPMAREYELAFRLRGRSADFTGFFHTIRRAGEATFESGNIKIGFLNALSAASGFSIFNEGRLLATLSLSGSRRAVNSMVECQNAEFP